MLTTSTGNRRLRWLFGWVPPVIRFCDHRFDELVVAVTVLVIAGGVTGLILIPG